MTKNAIIAIVLSALVLFVSLFVQTVFIAPQNIKNEVDRENAELAEKQKQEEKVKEVQALLNESSEEKKEELPQEFVVETGKAIITFTSKGGDIVSYKLKQQKSDKSVELIEMVEEVTKNNRALAVEFDGKNTVNDVFETTFKNFRKDENNGVIVDSETRKIYQNKDSSDFAIRFEKKYPTFKFTKTYNLKQNENVFKLDVSVEFNDEKHEVINYTLRTSPQIYPKNYKDDKYEIREYVAAKKNSKERNTLANKTYKKAYDWAGVASKYFTFLIKPENTDVMRDVTDTYVNGNKSQLYITRTNIKSKAVKDSFYVYIGPRSESELIKYNEAKNNEWNLNDANFNKAVKTSGILYWIEFILKWAMEKIFLVVRNWGVAIIILTLILKIVLFPLNKKTAMGSVKMAELQPKMQELQQKYKDKPQQLNLEMAKLYKQVGYNPVSGCLPMILQMIILFALYNVFNNYFEFRGASFISGWIDDLSKGDVLFTWKADIPFVSWFTQSTLRLLPFIYTISQLVSGKITQFGNPGSSGGQMKFMMYGLPLIFFFLFYNVPSGLLLYWTTSNILQIGQQIIINQIMKKKSAELAKNRPQLDANTLKFKGGKKKTR